MRNKIFFILTILLSQYLMGQTTDIITSKKYKNAIEKAEFLITEHKKQLDVPGVQVAVMIDGKLIWSKGFGFKDLVNKLPVTRNTKFQVASISKSITSIALGKLIQEGKIDIDADIRTYLPEFPEKKYPITARQLASNTAGIRHYTDDDPIFNTKQYNDVIESLEIFKKDSLEFKPGSKYAYSSYGWVLLSAVIQKIAKQSFSDYMHNTWKDLEMNNTTFDWPNKPIPNLTKLYGKRSKELGRRVDFPFDNRSYMYAGGGYVSTAEDLAKMGWKLISNEYLKPSIKNILFTPYITSEGENVYYGLGWKVSKNRYGVKYAYHGGTMGSTRSHLVMYPEHGIVFAYLANTGSSIIFNRNEAHTIAEAFYIEKKRINKIRRVDSDIFGKWKFKTTTMKGEERTGVLEVYRDNKQIKATMFYDRKDGKKYTFPLLLFEKKKDVYHFMAVRYMMQDYYFTIDGNSLKGKWFLDTNVNDAKKYKQGQPQEFKGTRITE